MLKINTLFSQPKSDSLSLKKNNIISLRLEFKKENKIEKGNALSKESDQENNKEKKFLD